MTSTSTDVAPRRAIGQLPPEIQQAIELRKAKNLVAAQIAALSWGEKLDTDTRRAVADWGLTFRVDATTEIHILGGRVYLNAQFYLRRLGELIAADLVEYAVADHVEDDPRLAKLGAEGEGESSRRLRERLKHGIPDACVSATVFRVKLRSMEQEVSGAKWCGTGKKNKHGNIADPIGEEFPVETSESRAARRAMRLLVSHIPKEIQSEIAAVEASAEMMTARIVDARERSKARDAAYLASERPAGMIASGTPDDPYASEIEQREKEAVKEPAAEVKAEAKPTPAPKPPTLADLIAGARKLLAHEKLTVDERASFEKMLMQADTEEKARYVIEEVEKLIMAPF